MTNDGTGRTGVNRREFLGRSAQQAAGVAVGVVGLASTAKAALSASDKIGVGIIGVRNQGKLLSAELARQPDVEVRTICDIDEAQFAPAIRAITEQGKKAPATESDFRRLLDDPVIDAVVIATPDHWHTAMTVSACEAGKDVYVESPLSHASADGRLIVEAAGRTGRVIQVGLQQRSGSHFQSGIEFVRSGRLGTVKLAKAWIVHRRKSIGRKQDCDAPAHVDYAQWLGPALNRPFNPNRFHFNWRWFWDYGGGELAHWGVHMLDVARWALNVDLPDRVSATGGNYAFDDDQQTPDTLAVQYSYLDKTILWEHRLWSGHGIEGRSSGVAFYGDRGTLIVDRGGWKVYDHNENITADASELLNSHVGNFIHCIKTREAPAADAQTGYVSSMLCNLGNLSYRLKKEITLPRDSAATQGDVISGILRRFREPGHQAPI